MTTKLREVGLGPALREVDAGDEGVDAVGRALVVPDADDIEAQLERAEQERRRATEEAERQAREDALTGDAMEALDKARRRNGRMKWTSTDGAILRRIADALRSLPVGEIP
jgi:hypothetical protein